MSLCDCNQGRLPCTCKPIEVEKIMNEVHRYKVVTMLSQAGATIGYDPHGPDVVMADVLDRVTAERDALQQLLNAADQKDDDLSFQLNDREASRYSWFQAAQAAEKRVEVLEAQLADRDALLREIRFKEDGHGFRVCKLGSYYTDKIDAALSASAEPSAPKCGNCDSSTGQSCNDKGCGYLEAGNGAPVERDERAEFEAVCKQLGYLTTRHHALSDQYKEITMQCMWQTWMARAALDKATEGGPCKACHGEGVIHTGIDESPTTTCNRCEGLGHE